MKPKTGVFAVRVFRNAGELARKAAQEVVLIARHAVRRQGTCTLALSGGSTPRRFWVTLSRPPFVKKFPWKTTHFFWGDERWVKPRHPRSNYRVFADSVLNTVQIPDQNIHPVDTELKNPSDSARRYEERIDSHFRLRGQKKPRFDLILLGLGEDGHVASLFPGTDALRENRRFVRVGSPKGKRDPRITLTLPVINNAACVIFLVTGSEKKDILRRVLEKKRPRNPLPAQMVNPSDGSLFWFVDREAASLLK